jgi:hypothetical protein
MKGFMQAWMKGKSLKVTRSVYTAGVNECRLNLMMTSMMIGRPQQTRNRTTTRISIFITCSKWRKRVMADAGYVILDGAFSSYKIVSLSDCYLHVVGT